MDVKDIMHTTVTTVTPEARVSTAYQMMAMHGARIRHLPVVTDRGTVVGILTDRDVRRAAASDTPHMAEHELLYLLVKPFLGQRSGATRAEVLSRAVEHDRMKDAAAELTQLTEENLAHVLAESRAERARIQQAAEAGRS